MTRTKSAGSGQETDPADAAPAGSAAEGTANEDKWVNVRIFLSSLPEAIEAGIFPFLCA